MSVGTDDGSDIECPTCGEQGFDGESGMKIHHAMAHGESIAGVGVECSACGESIRRPRAHVEEYETHHCKDCLSDVTQERFGTGEDHPHYDRRTVSCETCGDDITRPKCEIEESENNFCDRSCYSEWMAKNAQGSDSPAWKGGPVETECAACGEKTTQLKGNARRTERAFCDRGCYLDWHSENMVGEASPRWKGGPAGYGEGWTQQKRRQVRERDGFECQGCGVAQNEHLEEHGEKLHVHHIIPAREIDSAEERNAMENLTTLCRPCHSKAEQVAPLNPFASR